jgi:hypothetical protein
MALAICPLSCRLFSGQMFGLLAVPLNQRSAKHAETTAESADKQGMVNTKNATTLTAEGYIRAGDPPDLPLRARAVNQKRGPNSASTALTPNRTILG